MPVVASRDQSRVSPPDVTRSFIIVTGWDPGRSWWMLGRRALVAVARLRHLDEHLVRDDMRRRRVDAVLRRVRVGQEEALDLGEGDGTVDAA